MLRKRCAVVIYVHNLAVRAMDVTSKDLPWIKGLMAHLKLKNAQRHVMKSFLFKEKTKVN